MAPRKVAPGTLAPARRRAEGPGARPCHTRRVNPVCHSGGGAPQATPTPPRDATAGRLRRPALATAAVLLLAGGCSGTDSTPAREEPTGATLFPGHATIAHDTATASVDRRGPTALDGATLEEVLRFRAGRVAAYQFLGVFPAPYDPLAGPARRIWDRIAPKADWLGPTPYLVANPYLLVVVTCANHVTPLGLVCPNLELEYHAGGFVERHRGYNARCWLSRPFSESCGDFPGAIRIVMLNAFDAGYPFAHVDLAASANVTAGDGARNIARGIHSQSCYFHLGRRGVNNVSPQDRDGWLALADRDAATRIVVKLWRARPPSPLRPADLVYQLDVDPSA